MVHTCWEYQDLLGMPAFFPPKKNRREILIVLKAAIVLWGLYSYFIRYNFYLCDKKARQVRLLLRLHRPPRCWNYIDLDCRRRLLIFHSRWKIVRRANVKWQLTFIIFIAILLRGRHRRGAVDDSPIALNFLLIDCYIVVRVDRLKVVVIAHQTAAVRPLLAVAVRAVVVRVRCLISVLLIVESSVAGRKKRRD